MKIPFNKSYTTGKELAYIQDAIGRGHISGNGYYTKKCQSYFQERYGFKKCLLTTSCTDALEMAAILIDLKPGDEVIIPSYTFVSTANAFVLRGAKPVFCDSRDDHPGIDEDKIEDLITKKTKAIVPVHYAGVACDMDKIMAIAEKHGLFVIEDAAQAVDSFYKGRPLGGIGHLGCFSFHETKNISSGEGGMLAINDERFLERSEIIWEKGTNRQAFFRGEIDKYGWVDIGSSFLPSDMIAAYLWAQLQALDEIQTKRKSIWNGYQELLEPIADIAGIRLPIIPDYATNNAHMYYMLAQDGAHRDRLISSLKDDGIHAVFHYQSLHKSEYISSETKTCDCLRADQYTERLLRLPLYVSLSPDIPPIVVLAAQKAETNLNDTYRNPKDAEKH
ncbi:MAG: dTDP-4-amino-4,6-dideoxygalactose transaminase [Candidatus Cloacimonetes bacterium]|jgi:dTDP-4-amino-4,6-dideoxygalactose transaminase|nr:dTDP-4-amino-4,6-dideoxygalactose transaminase [Candidatus Cloacimonadota bacterium]